jgi:hypothetical protein
MSFGEHFHTQNHNGERGNIQTTSKRKQQTKLTIRQIILPNKGKFIGDASGK